jgi:hypothetical protein
MDVVARQPISFVMNVVEEGDTCATDWSGRSGHCSFTPA